MSLIRAKVTKEFDGVEDGTVYPRMILVGEEISGALAESAIGMKCAKETAESKADRNADDAELEEQARLKAEYEQTLVDLAALRAANTAKLTLFTHAQLVALAAKYEIDIATLTVEAEIIEAIRLGLETLEIEVPDEVVEPAATPAAEPPVDPAIAAAAAAAAASDTK